MGSSNRSARDFRVQVMGAGYAGPDRGSTFVAGFAAPAGATVAPSPPDAHSAAFPFVFPCAPPAGGSMFRAVLRAALALLAPLALATAVRAEEAPDVRLGRDVIPTFQSIRLHLDADKRNYSGSTHTDLNVAKATKVVQLHAEGQQLKRVSLRQGADTIHVAVERGDRGLLTLTADRALAPGKASLEIDFTHSYGTK